MFNRGTGSDATQPKPPQTGASQVTPPAQARPLTGATNNPFGPASTMGTSVIGTDLTILGEKITIISQNRLQIDGDVRGDVNGKQVIIGQDGSVIGTVSAEQIEVRGGVRGAIRAMSVTLQPTARVEGDIHHQTLSIAEGAEFDGRVRRPKDMSELKPVLDPAQISPGSGMSSSSGSSMS